MLANDGTSDNNVIAPVRASGPDYAVEAEIQLLKVADQIMFGLSVRDGGFIGQAYYDGMGNPRTYIGTKANDQVGKTSTFAPGAGIWHAYRMEVKGNSIRLLIDGNPVCEGLDNRYLTGGTVGIWDSKAQILVRSFKITAL